MMRSFIFLSAMLCFISVSAQQKTHIIPLSKKWASDFHFINDSNRMACLYLDLNDSYHFVLLDSNYNTLKYLTGRFNSSMKPELLGATAGAGIFDFYFKKVEDDQLLVLSVDTVNMRVKRTNSFQITQNRNEKILISGWNKYVNTMMTIAKSGNSIIFKDHLPEMKLRETTFKLTGDDIGFLNDASCVESMALNDSLWLLMRKTHLDWKSPKYRLFFVDLKSGNYKTVDFNCEPDKRREYYYVRFYDDIVIARECSYYDRIYKKSTGEFLTEVQIDEQMIRLDEDIPVLKYNYKHDFTASFGDDLPGGGKYLYLTGDAKKEIKNLEARWSIIEVDSVKYYRVVFRRNHSYPHETTYRAILAINPEDYSPDFDREVPCEKINKSITHYIDRDKEVHFKTGAWFWGFDDKICLGYIPKGKKEFRIEEVDF